MLSSTITWVSDIDLFKQLLDIPSYLIETPLLVNDLLIDEYIRTPLYKGLIKHEIHIQGSNHAIVDFNYLIQNDLKILTYTTRFIKVEEILGFTRQLQIALYQQGYITDIKYYMNGDDMTFVPMINGEHLYVYKHIDIDVDSFIGYKPLVDLYIDPVELKIAASDLIYQCDLTPFDYIVNYIPVVKVGGSSEKEVFATRAEFGMDKLLPIVSKIIDLYEQSTNVIEIEDPTLTGIEDPTLSGIEDPTLNGNMKPKKSRDIEYKNRKDSVYDIINKGFPRPPQA